MLWSTSPYLDFMTVLFDMAVIPDIDVFAESASATGDG
jgi:hypothetical protein